MNLCFIRSGFVGLFSACVIILCIMVVKFFITAIKEQRITDYMESIGYNRYLVDRSVFTNLEIWAYARAGSEYIEEDELLSMSLKEVKKRFKECDDNA